MSEPPKPPYGRLSTFYFFYFATLGILAPYWALYLQSLGFSSREIGELLAILMGTKLIAPYIWGWIADHTGKRVRVIQLGAFLAAVTFLMVYQVSSYWAMAGVMMLYSFFWNAIIAQFDAITMNHLGKEHHRYSVIRSWGSIGFIVTVMLLGPLIDQYGARVILPILTLVFSMIWLSAMVIPPDRGYQVSDTDAVEKVLDIIMRPEVMALFIVCFLMQFSHGPYYAFFSIYMEQHDYSKTMIGQYWALGVLAEVVLFLVIARLIKRYGAKRLMVASMAIAAVRWTLTAWFIESPLILLFSQMMHAATFGLYHAVAIYYFHHYFTGKLQGRGQALYSSVSFGAGGALGSLMSGYSWAALGPAVTYMIASGSVAVAAVIAIIAMRDVD
jgi:PPP family 3-phenylpropionic acid transporter